jgi:YesN/AraC family two-component response regulator
VQKLWSDYLNITCSVGISPAADSAEDFPDRLQSCNTYVTSKYLFGPGGIYTETEMARFNTEEMSESIEGFRPLWSAMKDMNSEALISAMQNIFVIMYRGSLNNARNVALAIIYHIMLHLADVGVDLWQHLNTEKEENLYQQISGLENVLDIERWSSNFIRWLFDYLEQQQITGKMNIMKKARRYISEHYSDSRLTLSMVADHVGLSEKYFSTRFARENDESFIDYLTNLRIGKAKQLIMKTDLKIYMVSDAVGFKSVEHFTRVFKKRVGISPRRYAEDKNE